jgi:hypothetical protein
MTRHLSDIHESIRGELAVSHIVRKPNLQDRLEWLTNFEANIKARVAKDEVGRRPRGVDALPGFCPPRFLC